MTDCIVAKNLNKHYIDGSGKKLHILKGIDIRFSMNRTASVSGASGSGKSTLLHLLGGLDRPSAGEVLFQDANIYQLSNNALANWRNRKVGFVFQAHYLLPDFTALENVTMPALIGNRSQIEATTQAKELLTLVGLADRLDHKPRQLSGGEQQRVAIARALINRPALILADEPTGNLDTKTGESVGNLLLQIAKEQSATLIVVTHNSELAIKMDVPLKLVGGKLVPLHC